MVAYAQQIEHIKKENKNTFSLDFYLNLCYSYYMKTDKYIIYSQYAHDHEFDGTLAECEEWIAIVDPKCNRYFIAHESE